MKVLITGAGGMLGSDLARLGRVAGHAIVALDRRALDITDAGAVAAALEVARPEAVVNCAAWTDVDGAESNEEEARRINGAGAGVVARAVKDRGARLLHVSSDYVFPGEDPRPRREMDRTEARSAYGRSKLAGERQVEAIGGRWTVVRSAWLYGKGGRNFVDTIRNKAEAGESLRVVDDQTGSPTWSVSLARGILDLLVADFTGIVHVANRGAVTWFELARAIVEELGLGVSVTPIPSAETRRPALRPTFSALDVELYSKLAGHVPLGWREAIRLYLGGASDEPAVP